MRNLTACEQFVVLMKQAKNQISLMKLYWETSSIPFITTISFANPVYPHEKTKEACLRKGEISVTWYEYDPIFWLEIVSSYHRSQRLKFDCTKKNRVIPEALNSM